MCKSQEMGMSKNSGLAIASLVLGITSLLLGFAFGIVAIVLGFIAISKINKEPELEGKGMAITGIILGFISFWTIILFIGALAYFGALSPDRLLPERCSAGQGFDCSDWQIQPDGTVSIVISSFQGPVTVQSVTLEECALQSPEGAVELDYGVEETFVFSCEPIENAFYGSLSVEYVQPGQTIPRTSLGMISGMIQ